MVLAALVGLAIGLSAVLFSELIELVDHVAFDVVRDGWLRGPTRARTIVVLVAGGLLTGPITMRLVRETRGQGVSDVMHANEVRGGRLRPIVAPAKALATALTIGSGGSAGREGPIVQIGASLGSSFAQLLRLSPEQMRLLAASGAAGGVAATFNAPIAGVFFALEVILRSFNTRNFSVVVLAAVVATVTSQFFRGDQALVPTPAYRIEHAVEVPLYALLGLVAAVVAIAFVALIYRAEDRFGDLQLPTPMLLPAIGGLLVGVVALLDAGVLGLSGDELGRALAGEVPLRSLLLLLLLKPVATALTIGSGGSGGVFRPALFLGAMTGGVYGKVVNRVLPIGIAGPGAYATVGMASVFAAATHAPLSAVIMLFELTRDHELMPALMIGVATATVTAQLLSRGSVYTIGLARRGVHIDEEQEPANVMQALRVEDAMSPALVSVPPDATLPDVIAALEGQSEAAALILDEEGVILGVITNADLNEAIIAGATDAPALQLATRDVHTVHPDQTLHEALSIFAQHRVRMLPVTSREGDHRPVGMLRRDDIMQAYSSAIEGRDAVTRRRRLSPAAGGDSVRYLELRVRPRSRLNGKRLLEVELTPDAVIVAVRHDGATLIPRGQTRLQAGDRVTVIAAASAVDEVRAQFEDA